MARIPGKRPKNRSDSDQIPPPPPDPVVIHVRGTPAPKGSAQAFAYRKGDKIAARVVPGGSKGTREKLLGWDGAVRDAARARVGERDAPPFVGVALRVDIEFRMARPAGHYWPSDHKTRAGQLREGKPIAPIGKPDRDKLERATVDALTGIVFDDDARIVEGESSKVWARPGEEGCSIRVIAIEASARRFIDIDWEPSAKSASPAQTVVDPALTDFVARAHAAQERIRGLIGGTGIAAELHAHGKHARRADVKTTGKRCEVCNAPTPYTDWKRCERHNGCLCTPGGSFTCIKHLPCDGDHALPPCDSVWCWHGDPDPAEDDFG